MTASVGRPVVSVVIPTHNRWSLLKEAVDSCLRQTYACLDIIIIDDGSTDETSERVDLMLASSWAKAGVRYQRQDNAGASAARNHGLRLARGDYVQFLDSDDLLMPSKITSQIMVLENCDFRDAPCCHCYGLVRSKSTAGAIYQRVGAHETDARALLQRLCSRVVHVLSTPSPLWRRGYLSQHAGWREDISLGDDLEYYVRLLVGVRMIGFVDEQLFVVREHDGSRLSTDSATAIPVLSHLRARYAVYESLIRAGLWDSEMQATFLDAMRTIYANVLTTRDAKPIVDLESWLWKLASVPKSRRAFKGMIRARQILGAQFLLSSHQLVKRLQDWKSCRSLSST